MALLLLELPDGFKLRVKGAFHVGSEVRLLSSDRSSTLEVFPDLSIPLLAQRSFAVQVSN